MIYQPQMGTRVASLFFTSASVRCVTTEHSCSFHNHHIARKDLKTNCPGGMISLVFTPVFCYPQLRGCAIIGSARRRPEAGNVKATRPRPPPTLVSRGRIDAHDDCGRAFGAWRCCCCHSSPCRSHRPMVGVVALM